MKKKVIVGFFLLMALFLLWQWPNVQAAEVLDSGTCGGNLTWELDDSGMLTISGTGNMTSFSSSGGPWAASLDRITALRIQDGVTSISDYAFSRCDRIAAVVIPDSVTILGQNAFYGCTGLTDVTIGSGVSTIDNKAFKNCSGLTRITIPGSVNYLGSDAFYGCTGLTEVTIGNGLATIDSNAFQECSSLTQITIPDSVNYLGESAFENCYALSSVTLGNGIKNIFTDTFSGCVSLASISIPDQVEVIYRSAFASCVSLKNVYLGKGVYNIAENAFYGCDKLAAFEVHADNFYLSSRHGVVYDKAGTTLVLYPKGKQGHFNVPDNVTTIGPYAFCYCKSLSSITFSANLSCIEGAAFQKCSGLKRITFLGDPPVIGPTAFFGVEATACYIWGNEAWKEGHLQNYGGTLTWQTREPDCDHDWSETEVFEPTCTEPGYTKKVCNICTYPVTEQTADALGHDNTAVTIQPTCEDSGSATYTCSVCGQVSIQKLYATGHSYENGSCSICGAAQPQWIDSGTCGDGLMWALEPDGTLTIWGEGNMDEYRLTYTENSAPWGQYRETIRKVIIQDGVASIGGFAFENCTALTSVTLADSVSVIGDNAFRFCQALTDVYLGNGLTKIGDDAFYSCESIVEITLPNNLQEIGESAFTLCSSLCGIYIPDSVTTIGKYVFSQCTGLLYISLPPGHSVSGLIRDSYDSLWHIIFRDPDAPHHYFGNAMSHFDDIEITVTRTESTCAAAGTLTFTCALCEESRSVALPLGKHTWKASTCTAPRTCMVCDATIGNPLGSDHVWDEGTVIQDPTDDMAGVMHYTCTVCSETKVEIMENQEVPAEPQPMSGTAIFIIIIVSLVAVIGGTAAVISLIQNKR